MIQAAPETSHQALLFGMQLLLPVSAEPVIMRMSIGYRWGQGSRVQDSRVCTLFIGRLSVGQLTLLARPGMLLVSPCFTIYTRIIKHDDTVDNDITAFIKKPRIYLSDNQTGIMSVTTVVRNNRF